MNNPNKIGLVVGILLGGFHACWSLLVLSGYAQAVYDFVLWAHMIRLPLVIGPFNWTAALTLVIMTFIAGYIMGYIASVVWNRLHR